jgi:hypothetical protein
MNRINEPMVIHSSTNVQNRSFSSLSRGGYSSATRNDQDAIFRSQPTLTESTLEHRPQSHVSNLFFRWFSPGSVHPTSGNANIKPTVVVFHSFAIIIFMPRDCRTMLLLEATRILVVKCDLKSSGTQFTWNKPMSGLSVCRVPGCQSLNTHTAAAHVCENCGRKGHHLSICHNSAAEKKFALEAKNDSLLFKEYCQIDRCCRPWTHITTAHSCNHCCQVGDDHLWPVYYQLDIT